MELRGRAIVLPSRPVLESAHLLMEISTAVQKPVGVVLLVILLHQLVGFLIMMILTKLELVLKY
jgi:hypothetical protein